MPRKPKRRKRHRSGHTWVEGHWRRLPKKRRYLEFSKPNRARQAQGHNLWALSFAQFLNAV